MDIIIFFNFVMNWDILGGPQLPYMLYRSKMSYKLSFSTMMCVRRVLVLVLVYEHCSCHGTRTKKKTARIFFFLSPSFNYNCLTCTKWPKCWSARTLFEPWFQDILLLHKYSQRWLPDFYFRPLLRTCIHIRQKSIFSCTQHGQYFKIPPNKQDGGEKKTFPNTRPNTRVYSKKYSYSLEFFGRNTRTHSKFLMKYSTDHW